MLTQEQINFYHENGYLGVEHVLSAEELDALRRVTDEFVEQSRQHIEHTKVYDLEPGHTPQEPRLRRLKNPILHHEVYAQTIRHNKILDIVEQLIGPGVRTNGNKLNMKLPSFGSAVEWHQDWAFYPHTNDDLLAVGVAIDDMNEENGCLMVVPGSHKTDLLSHHQDGVFVGAVSDPNYDPMDVAKITLPAGGISIHHTRILHASTPNHSANPRRLLLFQYCSIDSWPLQGFSNFDDYKASILRGEPTQCPRMVAAPVSIPLPLPDRTGSIYEIQTALQAKVMARK